MPNPKTFQLNSVEISLLLPKKLLNPAQESRGEDRAR